MGVYARDWRREKQGVMVLMGIELETYKMESSGDGW